jgi:hypothetical protein
MEVWKNEFSCFPDGNESVSGVYLLPKGPQTESGPARLKKMGQSTDCPGKGAAHSLSHENYFEICRNLARLRL